MSKQNAGSVATYEAIQEMIFVIRGQKVMIDESLARLYGVETKNLNKATNRNIERFPEDFMFRLTKEEHDSLRFQFGTLNEDVLRSQNVIPSKQTLGGHMPYVFTEQGISMFRRGGFETLPYKKVSKQSK